MRIAVDTLSFLLFSNSILQRITASNIENRFVLQEGSNPVVKWDDFTAQSMPDSEVITTPDNKEKKIIESGNSATSQPIWPIAATVIISLWNDEATDNHIFKRDPGNSQSRRYHRLESQRGDSLRSSRNKRSGKGQEQESSGVQESNVPNTETQLLTIGGAGNSGRGDSKALSGPSDLSTASSTTRRSKGQARRSHQRASVEGGVAVSGASSSNAPPHSPKEGVLESISERPSNWFIEGTTSQRIQKLDNEINLLQSQYKELEKIKPPNPEVIQTMNAILGSTKKYQMKKIELRGRATSGEQEGSGQQ